MNATDLLPPRIVATQKKSKDVMGPYVAILIRGYGFKKFKIFEDEDFARCMKETLAHVVSHEKIRQKIEFGFVHMDEIVLVTRELSDPSHWTSFVSVLTTCDFGQRMNLHVGDRIGFTAHPIPFELQSDIVDFVVERQERHTMPKWKSYKSNDFERGSFAKIQRVSIDEYNTQRRKAVVFDDVETAQSLFS